MNELVANRQANKKSYTTLVIYLIVQCCPYEEIQLGIAGG